MPTSAETCAVVDTNVLISAALIAGSPPAWVTRHLLLNGRVIFSPATFAEFEQRLWRPKFDRYLSMETRRSLLHDWRAAALWVADTADGDRFSRDADDDKFVHAALAGRAALLITGDADLLVLGTVRGIEVLSPAAAWARLGSAAAAQ